MNIVYIIIGAAFGAMIRANITIEGELFFIATFFINIIGSFLLGIVTTIAQKKFEWKWLKFGVGIGFLGSFTTFSTFSVEFYRLAVNQFPLALVYVFASVTFGLVSAFVGMAII